MGLMKMYELTCELIPGLLRAATAGRFSPSPLGLPPSLFMQDAKQPGGFGGGPPNALPSRSQFACFRMTIVCQMCVKRFG